MNSMALYRFALALNHPIPLIAVSVCRQTGYGSFPSLIVVLGDPALNILVDQDCSLR